MSPDNRIQLARNPDSKDCDDLYMSDDQDMIKSLLAARKIAVRVYYDQDSNSIVYCFNNADVTDLVNRILTGQSFDLTVAITDVWAAEHTWKMNLRRYQFVSRGSGRR